MAKLIGTGSSLNATCFPANTSLIIAADGTAVAAWNDGTQVNFSYAAPPYTSWTTGLLNGSGTKFTASAALDTNDNVWIIANDATNGITYYPLTKNGATYTLGTPVIVSSTQATTGFGSPMMTVKDPQGRYWTISNDATHTHAITFDSATPTIAGWKAGLSVSGVANATYPCAALVGNYLVVLWYTSSTSFSYSRLDVSQNHVGSWSNPVNVSLPGGIDATGSFRGNGAGVGMFVYHVNGIRSLLYNAGTNTWGTEVDVSTVSTDAMATLVSVQGDFYSIWRQTVGTTYALVSKKWTATTATWDVSPTTVVPSGSIVDKPQAAYGNGIVGVMYTQGPPPFQVYLETVTTV